jgi:hypothetical protein
MPRENKTPKESRTEVPDADKRYVLIELSCDERHCDPCTYPSCQRFVMETKKKKPFTSRIFEVSREHFENATGKK